MSLPVAAIEIGPLPEHPHHAMQAICLRSATPPSESTRHATQVSTRLTNRRGVMASLSIDLQDGFSDDTVVVRVEGIVASRESGVTTRTAIGLARTLRLVLDGASVQLEIELPERQICESIKIDLARPTFLGVSLTPDGKLTMRREFRPFGYV